MIAIIRLERGISSKRESSAHTDLVPALCTHRPSLLPIEWSGENAGFLAFFPSLLGIISALEEVVQTLPFRGRRSRNKVSVGEPAEGSLTFKNHIKVVYLLRKTVVLIPSLLFFYLTPP